MNVACSICLESFTLTSDIYTTPCGHVFHYDCIRKWLERGNKHCSQCRQSCTINRIVKLYFSENESALENNNLCSQLESENLKLQQEVDALKDRDLATNQKCTQLELDNLKLQQEVNALKAQELGANKYCADLKKENKTIHKRLCQGRSNTAGIDRVLKEQRKEINIKDQNFGELKTKCNRLINELEELRNNGYDLKTNEKKRKIQNYAKENETAFQIEFDPPVVWSPKPLNISLIEPNSGQPIASTSQQRENPSQGNRAAIFVRPTITNSTLVLLNSPVFEPPKGQCPMCNEMYNRSILERHAAVCNGIPTF